MRLQSSHRHQERGKDAYFTPPQAAHALLVIEARHLPYSLWEPAAGSGAIVTVLRRAGYRVAASDLIDYGLDGARSGVDYLLARPLPLAKGIVTNPPYRLARRFAEKALTEVPYLALLLRTNFLESNTRLPFFRAHPPARIWVSSRRLPMMHRLGWQGKRSTSNTCYAWFVWDAKARQKRLIDWFDWKHL